MKVADMMSTLYNGYMLRDVVRGAARFLKDNFQDVEFDKDYWLRKAGLSTYSPIRTTAGSVGIFLFGVVAGGIAALALAPKKGSELRAELKERARTVITQGQEMAEYPARRPGQPPM
jgi:hypothetical protein